MPEVNAAMTRLVVIHAALVAVPVLVVLLALGLWVLAVPAALVVGAGVTLWRTRGIDRRLARTIGARPVDADEVPRLAGLAEAMAMTVGEPVPHLWLIESESANALSWGVANGPSNLAVTTGLLEGTDRIGLEAVVGHQLGVVHSRAVEVVTLAAALFGPVARGPLAPLVARVVGADVHQQVERADVAGALTTRYPPAMVKVLESLRTAPTRLEQVPPALTGLCFAAPRDAASRFSVHPPIDDRIDLLREI